MMIVEIVKGKRGWFWRIKSQNGKILCHSETYRTHQAATKTASLVQSRLKVSKLVEVAL